MLRNDRSRSSGIGGHVGPEYAYRQGREDYAGQIVAAAQDLTAEVDSELVTEIEASELAHIFLQAISRAGRTVKDGKAARIDAYVVHNDARLQDDVAPAMRGVQWEDEPLPEGVRLAGRPTKAPEVARAVMAYLSLLDVSEITKRALVAAVPELAALDQDTRKKVWPLITGWTVEKHRLVRG